MHMKIQTKDGEPEVQHQVGGREKSKVCLELGD